MIKRCIQSSGWWVWGCLFQIKRDTGKCNSMGKDLSDNVAEPVTEYCLGSCLYLKVQYYSIPWTMCPMISCFVMLCLYYSPWWIRGGYSSVWLLQGQLLPWCPWSNTGGRTSYRKSREVSKRLDVIMIVSLCNLTCISAVLLSRSMSNLRAIGKV